MAEVETCEQIKIIAETYGYTLEQIRGRRRHSRLVTCRWNMYALLKDRGHSYPEIGRYFNRDHSTVIHGVRAWRELLDAEKTKNGEASQSAD